MFLQLGSTTYNLDVIAGWNLHHPAIASNEASSSTPFVRVYLNRQQTISIPGLMPGGPQLDDMPTYVDLRGNDGNAFRRWAEQASANGIIVRVIDAPQATTSRTASNRTEAAGTPRSHKRKTAQKAQRAATTAA
jgi:hypothetical protein